MTARRFLFVTWWGGGNTTPVRVLGRQLLDAGHQVRVLGSARLRDEFAPLGVEFVASSAFAATPGEVTAAIESMAPDAVVVDFMQPDVFAAAATSGAPWAVLVHTLGQGVLDGEHSTMLAFAPLDAINRIRAEHGLAPVERPTDLLGEADRVLVAGPEVVDRPPRRGLVDPARVRHLGALADDPGPDASWTPPLPDRPLVVVSLGTTPMDEAPVIQRVLDACADLPVAALATVGDHLDPSTFDAPPNVTVSRPVRHRAVLPHADVLVSHAGLGTVTAGLAQGLPLLCLPLGRDQYDNAARVVELGAGTTLDPTAAVEDLAAAIERVRTDVRLRAASRDVAARIAEESAPGRALGQLVALADRA